MVFPLQASINDDESIAISIKEKPSSSGNPRANHAPARTLIEGYYYSMTESVELSFLSNLGAVVVLLENITDGDVRDYVGNSSSGRMMFSVAPNSVYRMTISTENGRTYYAVFSTESGND